MDLKLDFEIGGHWNYDKDKEKALIKKRIEEIKATSKPIKYNYIAGFNNWVAETATEQLTPEDLFELFNNGYEYRVIEKADIINISRIENRW